MARRNDALEAVLAELKSWGITDVVVEAGGKHWRVCWNSGRPRMMSVSFAGGGGWGVAKKARCNVRRQLREDGYTNATP
jgi:hypothetical protein